MTEPKTLSTKEILHILRNPYGKSEDEKRRARLEGADEIEYLQHMLTNRPIRPARHDDLCTCEQCAINAKLSGAHDQRLEPKADPCSWCEGIGYTKSDCPHCDCTGVEPESCSFATCTSHQKSPGDPVDDTPEHLRKQGYRSGKSP